MSFTMSQGSQNGMMMQPNSFRQYVDPNAQPQIYSAIYSGVDVYEMEVNGVAVMRRRNDSWLNATQILKVAGIEKGKRTKVLEKEILIGDHEKVQGGYGKYQGTWIKFDRGVEFCRQYGVEQILRPLLTYDMGQDGGVAGKSIDTPTKEQAMAAHRKRLYNHNNDTRMTGQSGTFFKNISSTASNAVAAISKARFDSPAPRRINSRPASFSRQNSQLEIDHVPASQQSMQSFASDTSYTNQDSYNQSFGPQYSHIPEFQEPPRKRMRPNSMSQQEYYTQLDEATPTEPNDSFMYQALSDVPAALPPLPYANNKVAEAKRAMLMSLFMEDQTRQDFTNHEAFLTLSGDDLDMPIDQTAHTALHWAATLARLPLLKALIRSGASIFRVNGGGETALMRACLVRNNLDNGSLPDLLEVLGPTIEMRDSRGRTVLHHIAVTSAVKGRSQASKYYLESLLEFVVRSGSAPNSFYGAASKSIGIGRFMSEIVNAQDNSGDTALNIAARIGNRSIISQLLEVGSDAGIANRAGLRPVDFGIGDPAEIGERHISPEKSMRTKESSSDIISSITALLAETEKEFTTEMEGKQSAIDTLHLQLRESSRQLGEDRQRLERSEARAKERTERKFKIANLKRAEDEERHRLAQLHQDGHVSSADMATRMMIGDADKPFTMLQNGASLVQDSRLAHTLPSAERIHNILQAYASNNHSLDGGVKALRRRSRELEAKYRKLITLCVSVPDSKVDELLASLVTAVDSEQDDVELARVREFLQKVDSC